MTAMARHLDDLGPDFDLRWQRSPRSARRELIADLRDLYILLEEEDMPLLAGHGPAKAEISATKAAPQGSLFSDPTPAAPKPERKENPFLPRSVLDRLQDSQQQASTGLRELMQKTMATPSSHEQVDLERELRLKLGPVVERLIEAQMETLKSELRVYLRAEMDKLIAEHIRHK